MSSEYEYLVKLLVVGDSSVGKSCMLLRYSDDEFCDSHMTTIGVDFKLKNIKLDDKSVKIQIWDTAGQERFRTITSSYYRGAHGILLVYDVTNEKSFDSVLEWYEEIKEHAADNIKIMLVGNKIDLDQHRAISTEQGKKLADENYMQFIETSAKKGDNIEKAFLNIIKQVVESKKQNIQTKPTISVHSQDAPHQQTEPNGQGGGCC